MTLTVNLHNCTAWVTLTTYSVGARRSNDTSPVKAYQCTTAGTSGVTGPTGTGSSISDGTCVWKYLSAVDYTSFSAAVAGIGTLSQPTIIAPWNDATWNVGTGANFTGNSTTSSNTLLVEPPTGESFTDNANAQTNALSANQANGVLLTCSGAYHQVLQINEPYVTISKIQTTAAAGSYKAIYGRTCGNLVISQCIIDSSTGGGVTDIASNNPTLFRNSVLVFSSTATGIIVANGTSTFANCTIVRPAFYAAAGSPFIDGFYQTNVVKNTAMFGFSTQTSAHSTFTNCASDLASPPTGVTGSLSFSAQFVNTGSTLANMDFRLKAGANLLDAGITDTTDIPAANDIVGTARPQGTAWDIGAWELVVTAATGAPSITNFGELIHAPNGSRTLGAGLALLAAGVVARNPIVTKRQIVGLAPLEKPPKEPS